MNQFIVEINHRPCDAEPNWIRSVVFTDVYSNRELEVVQMEIDEYRKQHQINYHYRIRWTA